MSGIAARAGLTLHSQVDAASLGLMIEHARQVNFAADQSKYGRVAFASLVVHAPELARHGHHYPPQISLRWKAGPETSGGDAIDSPGAEGVARLPLCCKPSPLVIK